MVASHPAKLTRLLMCWICSLGLSEAVLAADKLVRDIVPFSPFPVASTSSIKPISAASKIFARPVYLRGMLGNLRVQMYLQPHVDYEESVQGNYFVFGKIEKILLAGEFQGDDISIEESVNGSDVSGQWSGRLEGVVFRGIWYSDDQSRSLPFELTVFEPKDVPSSTTTSITKNKVRSAPVGIRNRAHHE